MNKKGEKIISQKKVFWNQALFKNQWTYVVGIDIYAELNIIRIQKHYTTYYVIIYDNDQSRLTRYMIVWQMTWCDDTDSII